MVNQPAATKSALLVQELRWRLHSGAKGRLEIGDAEHEYGGVHGSGVFCVTLGGAASRMCLCRCMCGGFGAGEVEEGRMWDTGLGSWMGRGRGGDCMDVCVFDWDWAGGDERAAAWWKGGIRLGVVLALQTDR